MHGGRLIIALGLLAACKETKEELRDPDNGGPQARTCQTFEKQTQGQRWTTRWQSRLHTDVDQRLLGNIVVEVEHRRNNGAFMLEAICTEATDVPVTVELQIFADRLVGHDANKGVVGVDLGLRVNVVDRPANVETSAYVKRIILIGADDAIEAEVTHDRSFNLPWNGRSAVLDPGVFTHKTDQNVTAEAP